MTPEHGDGLEIETIPPIQDHVVVSLRGELDIATVGLLKTEVAPMIEPGRRVVLDLAEIAFCDSAGLGGIIGLLREADAAAASLVLAGPDERLSELLRITGIDGVAEVAASVEDALRTAEAP